MNERIKELAVEADLLIKKSNGDEFRYGNFDPRFQKFAELIVRDIHAYVDGMDTAQVISNGILRRYGVEL